MKNAYPIVLTPDGDGYVVYIPDFHANTQGYSLTEAIEMARDAIGLVGIEMQDEKQPLPQPSPVGGVNKETENDIVTLVDIDFDEYRRKNDMRSVRRNVTLPSWLDYEATKSGINVSAVLQEALKDRLHIQR